MAVKVKKIELGTENSFWVKGIMIITINKSLQEKYEKETVPDRVCFLHFQCDKHMFPASCYITSWSPGDQLPPKNIQDISKQRECLLNLSFFQNIPLILWQRLPRHVQDFVCLQSIPVVPIVGRQSEEVEKTDAGQH